MRVGFKFISIQNQKVYKYVVILQVDWGFQARIQMSILTCYFYFFFFDQLFQRMFRKWSETFGLLSSSSHFEKNFSL